MSEIEDDLQSRLKRLADEVGTDAARERVVLDRSRGKRRLVAMTSGLMGLLLVGGIAGASMLVRGGDGIEQAPRPGRVTEEDLASMTVDELAAALFSADELEEATPSGFTVDQIVRNGPEETNDDYATVGVQMSGPVDYARVIFFVHPTPQAASEMREQRLRAEEGEWRALRRVGEPYAFKPLAVPDALPGTRCGIGLPQLLSCHAVLGQVMVLSQSSTSTMEQRPVTEEEIDAATKLIRSFGSYLERVYPKQADSSLVRYYFKVDEDNTSASGRLTVKAGNSICLDVQTRNITASHLLWMDPNRPDEAALIALTFFDPNGGEEGANLPPTGTHCFAGEQLKELRDDGLLERLVDEPREFRIDFHRGPNDDPGLIAELRRSPALGEFSSIEHAVAYLAKRLKVDVALPRELPSGIHLAQGQSVTVDRDGNIESGRLALRYGKKGHLILDYGRAIFDGCGGDGAQVVDVNGVAGLLLAKDQYPWTQIIWPAEPGDREATYGIYGSLRAGAMLEMARSMQLTVEDGAEKTEGCL